MQGSDSLRQIEQVRFLDKVRKGRMNNQVIGYGKSTSQMEEPSRKCKESECSMMSCISFVSLVSLLLKSLLSSGKIQSQVTNKQITLPRRLWVEKSVLGPFKVASSSAFVFFSWNCKALFSFYCDKVSAQFLSYIIMWLCKWKECYHFVLNQQCLLLS